MKIDKPTDGTKDTLLIRFIQQKCIERNARKVRVASLLTKSKTEEIKAKSSNKDKKFRHICSLSFNKTKSSTTLDPITQPQTLENLLTCSLQ